MNEHKSLVIGRGLPATTNDKFVRLSVAPFFARPHDHGIFQPRGLHGCVSHPRAPPPICGFLGARCRGAEFGAGFDAAPNHFVEPAPFGVDFCWCCACRTSARPTRILSALGGAEHRASGGTGRGRGRGWWSWRGPSAISTPIQPTMRPPLMRHPQRGMSVMKVDMRNMAQENSRICIDVCGQSIGTNRCSKRREAQSEAMRFTPLSAERNKEQESQSPATPPSFICKSLTCFIRNVTTT
jgi:hypothetical protein